MTETQTLVGFSKQALEALSHINGEPEWMLARRLEAWHVYNETPLPGDKDELWRRTSLQGLKLDTVVPFVADDPKWTPARLPEEFRGLAKSRQAAGALIMHNGRSATAQLKPEYRDRGVILCDMNTALREHPDLVREHFMTRAVSLAENRYARHVNAQGVTEHQGYSDTIGDLKFASLHGAFWNGGTFLYVPRNVVIEQPINTLTYFDAPEVGIFSHSLIILEQGASVRLIEDLESAANEAQRFGSRAVELILRPNSDLQYFNLQDWAQNVWDFTSQTAILERNTNLVWLAGMLGSAVTKAFLDSRIEGSGANVRMLGFFFGDKEQHFDQHTFQNHIHPNGKSDLLYKGALKDKAYSAFRGLIRINPDAQRSDAYQQNRNLLLSNRAHADSIPELEIEANDVRCTHGATVGPIEEAAVFYLMARGIPRPEAERLFTEGFFDELISKVPLQVVQDRLFHVIRQKIVGL
ncbi:MAG: Fe-S cluster assembly protein SufD [Anaerolineae bacterium]|nr:Fe-S cluster assembly protein SufD [Anaerolineae bacterium]